MAGKKESGKLQKSIKAADKPWMLLILLHSVPSAIMWTSSYGRSGRRASNGLWGLRTPLEEGCASPPCGNILPANILLPPASLRAVPDSLWQGLLPIADIVACCLLSGFPVPPLLFVPNFLSHPWVSVSPQAPATPTLLWAMADRAQHCRGLRGLRGEAEGKAFQQRRKAWLILHAVRPKWWTRFLGRMEENHPDWNREDLTYFHYY